MADDRNVVEQARDAAANVGEAAAGVVAASRSDADSVAAARRLVETAA